MSTNNTVKSSPPEDIVRDIFLWRRKKLSLSVLIVATAIWVLLEVYEFTLITIASWVGLFIATSLFVWGYVLRLVNKEIPDLSGLEIAEETAVKMGRWIQAWVQKEVRWMIRLGAEGNWLCFAQTVVVLGLLSYVGQFFDLLTFLYIGLVLGMTVLVIYEKYGDKLKDCMEKMKVQCERYSSMVDEKVIKKVKNKMASFKPQKKDNKTE